MRNGKEQWLVPEVYGVGRVMGQPLNLDIAKKGMLATRMNHCQTVIIKRWIHIPRDPETRKVLVTNDIPEEICNLLDLNPEQDVVPVLEHTTYSPKNRGKSRYHNANEMVEILANRQLGNSVAELSTQVHQPPEAKTDESTESLVGDKHTESQVGKSAGWKKSEWKGWGNSYWLPQSWGASGSGWSGHSWQEKDNSAKKQKMSDNIQKESTWRKRQAVCYTTHYRGILSVISSFPVDHYGINKGNYVSPDMGQQCDPSTVYPIPTGDLLEYGRTQPEILRGVKVPDDNTPVNDIPDVWKE